MHEYAIKFAVAARNLGEREVQKLFSIENSYVENHPSSRKKFIYINNKNYDLMIATIPP